MIAAATLAAVSADAQTVSPTNSAPNPYRTIEGFGQMPDGRIWGSTAGVDIDRDGSSIWVAERCGAQGFIPPSQMREGEIFNCDGSNLDPILKFDGSGKLVKAFGAGMFVFPHGLHVDFEGNVWVTDGVGRGMKGQTVHKFSPDGKLLMTLGTPGKSGDGPNEFNAPSAVLVAPNGNIFVADGHGGNTNARIVKFSRDGKFIKTWGKKGSAPGEMDGPHTLAMDSQGRLFLGDRGNNRIQIFDQDGNYIDQWTQFSRQAVSSSTRRTTSMSPIPNRSPCPRTMTAGSAASGSDACATPLLRRSFQTRLRRPPARVPRKALLWTPRVTFSELRQARSA